MSNLFLLKNSEIIDLFEIKLNDFEGYLYFHGSKNFNKDLVFQGRSYLYIPCEMSNLQYDSEGKQNRPTFSISNVNNFISNIIKDRGDLLGKEFYRKKLLAKDLDAVNFGGKSKNPLGVSTFNEFISSDKFVINKKNLENKERVEFELSNILDIDGLTCPSRKVYNNSCPWQYRGYGCNYGKNLGYSGPYVSVLEPAYTTLEGVVASYDGGSDTIREYLGSWFNYSGVTVSEDFSQYVKYLQNFGPEVIYKYFKTATAWENKAGDINASASGDVLANINTDITWTSTLGPVVYYNTGRLKNNYGICPILPNFGDSFNQFQKIQLSYDFSGKDLTVFYIAEPTNAFAGSNSTYTPWKKNGGYFVRGLQTENLNTFIGYSGNRSSSVLDKNSKLDSVQIKNANNRALGSEHPLANNVNTPIIYSCSIPKDNYSGISDPGDINKINLFKNGYKISSLEPEYGSGLSHDIENLGFNSSTNTSSHIVIYEIIIFQKLLSETQIKSINSYLGYKYGVDVNDSEISNSSFKPSSEFFGGFEDGNLGIPIADENDKLFLRDTSEDFRYYDSYNFQDLIYKGDYNSEVNYQRGDFVKIDPDINFDFTKDSLTQNSELPSRFFICISKDGSKGIDPLSNSQIWKEDKCSKKLSGCLARFRVDQTDKSQKIPFGGFPGTVSYDYELPS